MIFGHFIYFGHFPIEIPIESEKIYHHGKELSYRENKMCSETSEAVGTIWEHAQKEFQKFLKIRITLIVDFNLKSPSHPVCFEIHELTDNYSTSKSFYEKKKTFLDNV